MKKTAWIMAMATTAGLFAVSTDANAIVAASGNARLAADRDFFQYEFGRVWNTSTGTTRLFTIPYPSVGFGSFVFRAQGCGDIAQLTTCDGIVVDRTGWFKASTGPVRLKTPAANCGGITGATTLGTVFAAGNDGDGIIFECSLRGTGNSSTYLGQVSVTPAP